ncbi:MAG: LysR family transcriptional regulator [Azoarcus sp.]|nr:LysR family transcriptional regulator [Azoarcus sp.]
MKDAYLAELKAFDAAATHGSMSVAARKLGLQQPTISLHIRQLEQRFGVELFFRRGRRVELTPFGASLREITRRIFRAEEEAMDLLLSAQNLYHGHLKLCAVGPYNVTPMIKAFSKRWPRVRISVELGDSREVIESVLDYRCDVGVVVHRVDDPRIHSLAFRRQDLIVFAPANHPLAGRRGLSPSDLEGQDFVFREVGSTTRKAFEEFLERNDVRVRCALEMGSREAVREAVAQELGLGVVSDAAYVADARLVQLEIDTQGLSTHAHVICLEERVTAPLVHEFLQVSDELRACREDKAA